MKITNKGLYWGLIATFGLLYVLVAFVSTLHAIDFFYLSNIGSLAILLGIAYEVGQASVLFSILMTKNKEKFLPWVLMILLTALQVTANVYASFKHMATSGNDDWTYWYTSILKIFGVTGGTPESYQVIISWISGALLPIVALGMTALVAQNIKLITEDSEIKEDSKIKENINEPIPSSEIIAEISKIRPTEEDLEMAEAILSKKKPEGYFEKEIPMNHPIGHDTSTLKDEEKNNVISEEIPTTPAQEFFPALSDEEVTEMFHKELEGKLDIDHEEEDESIIDDTHLLPENELQIEPNEAQLPVENEPQSELNELQSLDITTNNGLLEISHEPITRDIPPDVKVITAEEAKQREKEQEEARLEHLRAVARENLKKK
jgi:hypothetical protein